MAKRPSFVSGKGRLGYPHLTTPDTKFDAEGTFHTKSIMALADGQKDIDRITAEHERYLAEVKAAAKKGTRIKEGDLPFVIDEENQTVTFAFKLNATGKNKKGESWKNKVAIFDSMGKPASPDIKIGSGTLAKISYEFNPYSAAFGTGISLRMKAVQILELVEWGGGDAKSYGFGEEEGSFGENDSTADVAEDEVEETPTTDAKKDGSDF